MNNRMNVYPPITAGTLKCMNEIQINQCVVLLPARLIGLANKQCVRVQRDDTDISFENYDNDDVMAYNLLYQGRVPFPHPVGSS